MKNKQDIKQWILDNCVDNNGNIDLKGLDFSDFEGSVMISQMKVKKDLLQHGHEVGGDLDQDKHKVGGFLYQSHHNVSGNLHQCGHEVGGNLYQRLHRVSKNLHQGNQKVEGDLYQSSQEVGGDLYQCVQDVNGFIRQTENKFGDALYFDKLNKYSIVEMSDGELKAMNKPKAMTMKELEAIVGYEFEIVGE